MGEAATIDTAPRDGTHILGKDGFWREMWLVRDQYEGEFWRDEFDSEPEPTHWAPLPDPTPRSDDADKEEDEAYELGKRDGFEEAVQTIDERTGGDGEFYGSTIPGRGQDVPSMLEGIVERFDERFEQYRNARDALFQFNNPPDPKLLREIANEIDCGNDCAHGHTEWDTNAHVCSRSESKEGCASEKAWCLRQFADAVDIRSALPASDEK